MNPDRAARIRARAKVVRLIRSFFDSAGWDEVETPCLVPAPGMEPHIQAFETRFVPEGGGEGRPLYLHTSPEYAMKRLLAEGWERIFQIVRVFRNGEVSASHNPEFTMLEIYRAGTDYRGIMEDLEAALAAAARGMHPEARPLCRFRGAELDFEPPFERLTVAEAFASRAGIDLEVCGGDAGRLREAAERRGHPVGPLGERFDDLFFRIFLTAIEPGLGWPRPVYLTDWPASMAALAKLLPDNPRWAERFELYAGGVELANGFSELNDAAEQRRRLEAEQAQRRAAGRPVPPIDEQFLEAVGRMPDAGGVALGVDRLAMVLTDAESVGELLAFPFGD
jgi:lysyl-tRNA synthetase class 2